MENGNGSKDPEEEKIVDAKERVEPVRNRSGIECPGDIENGERVEKEPLSETNDGQLELITKDENSMESRTGTEMESFTTENIPIRPDDKLREIGVGSEKGEEDNCDSNNNTDNAKSDLSSKSGDGGLDKLHQLEPIWVKRAEILLGEKKETRAGIGKAEGSTFSGQDGGILIRLPCKTSSVPATCFVRWLLERKRPRSLAS